MTRFGLAALLLVGCGSPPERVPVAADLAFVGVDVVPMDTERVLRDQTVLIGDGTIRAIGDQAELAVPAGAQKIDGRGKYLLPGLADMHAHVWNEDHMVLFLANGVTTVRNLFGAPVHLEWRERVAAGELFGPTIHTAGPIVDGDPPASRGGGRVVISTPGQAVEAVRAQAAAGYDFIKVYSLLSPEAYAAVVGTAAELDIPVAGHVPVRVGLLQALASGLQTIEHLTTYNLELQSDDSPYHEPGSVRAYRDVMRSWEYIDSMRLPPIVDATAASGVWNCPTLVVTESMTPDEEVEEQMARPEMRYLSDAIRDNWRPDNTSSTVNAPLSSEERRRARATLGARQGVVKALHDGGCGILLGTDCMNPFVVPGFSVHDELQLLVQAGLTPYEALCTGTRNAADALGQLGEFGTVTVGARADLLLLDGNPLDDVSFANDIAGVVVRGTWYPEPELRRKLEELAVGYGSGAGAHMDESISAEDLLDRHVQATGGAQAHARLHNRVTRGRAELRGFADHDWTATFVRTEAPEFWSETLTFGDWSNEEGRKGELAWGYGHVKYPRIAHRLKADSEIDDMVHLTVFNGHVSWRERYAGVELAGRRTVDGTECHEITLTPDEGQSVSWLLDTESLLLVKTESRLGGTIVETYPSDYRTVDGVLLPHRIVRLVSGGGPGTSMPFLRPGVGKQDLLLIVDSIDHNVDTDSGGFALPAVVLGLADPNGTTRR